jgi:hypothetical protein
VDERAFTMERAAQAAAVGVETIRYYERRGLVPQPAQTAGSYRKYDRTHVARIRFIRRAQELGFSLQEIDCPTPGTWASAAWRTWVKWKCRCRRMRCR